MDERRKKVLVIAVAAVLVVPLAGWRIMDALKAEPRPAFLDRPCRERIKRQLDRNVPVEYRAHELRRHAAEPRPPHVRLGALRMPGELSELQRIAGKPDQFFVCMYEVGVELGANVAVVEGIDDAVPELPQRYGELIMALHFVHAGELSEAQRTRFGSKVAAVTGVRAGEPAEAGGLQPGDLVVAEKSLPGVLACELLDHLKASARADFTVLRDGKELQIALDKTGRERFGIDQLCVPVLSAAAVAALR